RGESILQGRLTDRRSQIKSLSLTFSFSRSKIVSVDEKPSVSDDFWGTSTCEMDNSTMQSQRSMSSISFTNNTATSESTSNPTEFVNNGEMRFPHTVVSSVILSLPFLKNIQSFITSRFSALSRQQWLGNGTPQTKGKLREPTIRSRGFKNSGSQVVPSQNRDGNGNKSVGDMIFDYLKQPACTRCKTTGHTH
ncbi:unnamed protein product, partial [Thlaspi arvense]